MSRFQFNEVFWRPGSSGDELVRFARNYPVFIYKRGSEEPATLWSAEAGGVEVPQPLHTDGDGQAVDGAGHFVWLDYALYDVVANGQRFPWPPFSIAAGEGGVTSVQGKTGVVVLTPGDIGAQPVDADLTAIAALATTAFGRSLLALANAAGGRTALELGSAAQQASSAFDAAGAAAAAQAASQPLDSDLTAIAALSTTAFGRELLTMANAAAARTALALGSAAVEPASAFQPADADLTAIAALATTAFGRELLTKANAAAVRTAIEAASTTEAGEKVPKSLVTTKGDLVAASAASTPARLAAGTNGQILAADSTQAAGLKWISNNDLDSYTFCLTPTATTLGGFFVRIPAGMTVKLVELRAKTASGSCKLKVKRTTSGGATSEPLKEKEAKAETQGFEATTELADKDLLELICESISTPGVLYATLVLERTR